MKIKILLASALVLTALGRLSAQIEVISNGSVGVGTASPSYKLDVNGVVNATDFRGTVGATTPNTVAGTVVTASTRLSASYLIGTSYLGSYQSSTGAIYLGFTGGGSYIRSVGNNSGSAAAMVLQIGNGTDAVTLSTARGVRFNAYGAGTLTTDSSGNVIATSDERAKDTVGDFTTGLAAIRQLQPKKYHWKKSTGLNVDDLNVSVYAQDLIAAGLPEAVSTQRTEDELETVDITLLLDEQGRELDQSQPIAPAILAKATSKTIQVIRPKKNTAGETITKKVDATYYTVSDRAVIAALINAAKELADKNDALEARLAKLEASDRAK